MTGTVMDIKRFAVHDGDGIRTTVFLKGCPLKCIWCHNPEGIGFKPQLAYYKEKCVNCRECANVCPNNAHTFDKNGHIFNRSLCSACFDCTKVCIKEALKPYGQEMSVKELMPMLLEDKDFYENSNGGVTLSGGECLMQPDFCEELLKNLKKENINTAVDTCGMVKKEILDKVAPYTDVFLYDIKAIDEDVHIKCTGHSNKLILENIKYLDSLGKDIEVRIPYVPGFNSDQIEKIADFLVTIKHLTKVRVLAYHNYAASKYDALGMEDTLPSDLPTDEEIEKAKEYIISKNIKVV